MRSQSRTRDSSGEEGDPRAPKQDEVPGADIVTTLPKLAALLEKTTRPTSPGGAPTPTPEQWQEIRERDDRAQESSCWRLADDVLALLDVLDEAEKREAVLRDLLGPDYHVYEQREDGWSIKHPIACRDEMLDCPVHKAVSLFHAPPVAPGRYRVELGEQGLDFAALTTAGEDA
jgi:hypothetical protein